MAFLFTRQGAQLSAMELVRDRYLVGARPEAGVRVASGEEVGGSESIFALRRSRDASGREVWVLLAGGASPVQVNGRPLVAGLLVLAHRDALSFFGGGDASPRRLAFSGEALSRAALYSGEPVDCLLCLSEIVPGRDHAAACACGARFHVAPSQNCFTYGDCVVCGARQALDGRLLWRPSPHGF